MVYADLSCMRRRLQQSALIIAVIMQVGWAPAITAANKGSSTSCELQKIKKVPYTIKCSGVYCLTDDFTIEMSTTCSFCATGITINASNVVLNLNGYTLSSG